jgi:thiamine biosynthesis lipoprotein ApbE
MCATSGGAFDTSVGPLVRAWGFYTESPGLPELETSRSAASPVAADRVVREIHTR